VRLRSQRAILKRLAVGGEVMDVTVEVVGEGTHELSVGDESTYADLVTAVDLRVDEVSVLVDGRPVPEDRTVDAEHVRVLRLVKGGDRA
jgi:sulfur carrier protein